MSLQCFLPAVDMAGNLAGRELPVKRERYLRARGFLDAQMTYPKNFSQESQAVGVP